MGHGKEKASEEDTHTFDNVISALVVEFPQLDESLIRVIVSDHDILDPAEKKKVDELLSQLADGASKSWLEQTENQEQPFSTGTITEALNDLSSPPKSSEEEQLAELQVIFPNTSIEHLKHTLQECNKDFNRAIDVLINEDFLASEQSTDAISTLKSGKKSRRQRGKKKTSSGNSSSESLIDTPAIVPHYKPVKLEEHEEGWTPTPVRSSYATSLSSSSSSTKHASAAQDSFAKAAHYARLGRSNPLYNSAASFYSTNARQALDAARNARSEEADARVARATMRNPRQLDLHGVSAADAKRIALEKTRIWWEGLGEKRHELTSGEAWKKGNNISETWFVIVVGKGTHSAGQRAVLGPAVMKALQEDGWKIEDEIGQAGRLVVKGRKSIKRK